MADDARLDPSLLIRDKGVPEGVNCWRYIGVVDVTKAAVIDVAVLGKSGKCHPLEY